MSKGLTELQIEGLEKFKESRGMLNKGLRLLYDQNMEAFLLEKVLDNDDIDIIKKETAQRLIETNLPYLPLSHVWKLIPLVHTHFNPTSDKVLEINENTNITKYNLFDIKKTGLEDCKIIREEYGINDDISFINNFPAYRCLFSNLFSDKESHIEYMINYYSTIINLRCKVPVSIIIFGDQGAGKGVLEEFFIRKCFGDSYCTTLSNAELEDDRNNAFFNKMFVVFNEVETSYKNKKVAAKVKTLITEPRIVVRALYTNPVQMENHINTHFFSNSSGFKLDMDDRRVNVFNSKLKLMDAVEKCFGTEFIIDEKTGFKTLSKFLKMLESETDEFILELKRYDFSFDRVKNILETEEKKIMAESTTTIKDKLKRYLNDGDFLSIKHDLEDINEMLEFDINYSSSSFLINLHSLEDGMKKGYLLAKDTVFLYDMFLDDEKNISNLKKAKTFNTIIGETNKKNGNSVRFIKNKYIPVEVETEEIIIDEEIMIDGSTKKVYKTVEKNIEVVEEKKITYEKGNIVRYDKREDFLDDAMKNLKGFISEYNFKGNILFYKLEEKTYQIKKALLSEKDISILESEVVPF